MFPRSFYRGMGLGLGFRGCLGFRVSVSVLALGCGSGLNETDSAVGGFMMSTTQTPGRS